MRVFFFVSFFLFQFPDFSDAYQSDSKVVAGGRSTCYFESNSLFCSGENSYGQAPNIHGLIDPSSLSVGEHTCFIDDGEVWCFGQNRRGQAEPEPLIGPKQVAVGDEHTCALDLTGVQCWGHNDHGQLDVPEGLGTVVEIKTGGDTSCAKNEMGSVTCWGRDFSHIQSERADYFSVGDRHVCIAVGARVDCHGAEESLKKYTFPDIRDLRSGDELICVLSGDQVRCLDFSVAWRKIEVPEHKGAKWLSVGKSHLCFGLEEGEIQCAGTNSYGQLQWNGRVSNPTQIFAGAKATCADDQSGLHCWGFLLNLKMLKEYRLEEFNQISFANGDRVCGVANGELSCSGRLYKNMAYYPDLTNVSGVHLGGKAMCLIVEKKVYCYGDRNHFPDEAIEDAQKIVGGSEYFCVQRKQGVVCWGKMKSPPVFIPVDLLVGGSRHACLYREDQGIYCWGFPRPKGITRYPDISGVLKMTAGFSHTCALTKDAVHCWGNGQVTSVPELKNPYDIASGVDHACALDDTGLVCWGNNNYNQAKSKPLSMEANNAPQTERER